MGQAMLADYAFRVDPENISWSFGVKTKVTYTIGGKVVQVYGTQIGPMTLSGSFGLGGFEEQERFLKKMTALAKAQGEGTNKPYRFLFPQRNWDFKVFIRSVATPDGSLSMHVSPEIIDPRWVLTLHIVEENAGLKKIATDAYIARLSEGIGWHPSAYNGPADYQAMLDEQQAWEDEHAPSKPTIDWFGHTSPGQANADAHG